MPADIVVFTPGWHAPREQLDPMDLAVYDVENAAHDIAQVIFAAQTVDAALDLRRRVAALVLKLDDLEKFATARAEQLNRQERVRS